MSGHGHVTPNPNGAKARCGGPTICSVCALEFALLTPKSATDMFNAGMYLEPFASMPKHVLRVACGECRFGWIVAAPTRLDLFALVLGAMKCHHCQAGADKIAIQADVG